MIKIEHPLEVLTFKQPTGDIVRLERHQEWVGRFFEGIDNPQQIMGGFSSFANIFKEWQDFENKIGSTKL